MKFTANRQLFADAVGLASQCVPTRDVKPVFKNLKITVNGTVAELASTDMEIGLTVSCAVDGDAGSLLFPADRLKSILGECQTESVTIEEVSSGVMLMAGFAEFEMETATVAEFPEPAVWQADKPHTLVNADALKQAIGRCAFAAAKDSVRYATNGVLLVIEKEQLTLVATDGRRLSVESVPVSLSAPTDKHTVILPSRAISTLRQMPEDGDVSIFWSATEALFKVGTATLYTRLVEGRYPNYEAVIPKTNKIESTFKAGEMLRAARQAATMCGNDSKRMVIKADGSKFVLSAGGPGGRSKVEIPVASKAFDLAIDQAFIQDLLKNLAPDSDVKLYVKDEKTPVLLTCGKLQHVIMPLA